VCGLTKVPAVLLTDAKWQDEDLQKLVTVRLNVLQGKLDPTRMAMLYDEMATKYGEEALKDVFAYTDEAGWNSVLDSIKSGLKKAGIKKAAIDKFDKDAREKKSVAELGTILNQLYAEHGDTVEQNFMVFTYGNKEHVYISMDKVLAAVVRKITNYCKATGTDIVEVLTAPLQQTAAALKESRNSRKAAPDVEEEDVQF